MEMSAIDKLMRQAVAEGIFPGGVLLVSAETEVIFFEAFGLAHLHHHTPMTVETFFDLASLTKPLATTLAVIRLVQNRSIGVEQKLAELLPEFKDGDKARIRIKHLLYHNSGLPDYRPYYEDISDIAPESRRDALRGLLVKEPLIQPIGEHVLYSDLGFMILSWIVECVSGRRLDHFVADEIYRSLGLKHLFFNAHDADSLQGPFAATENCSWRRQILVGQVHDENAFVVGGVEGHAGLFGTAGEVNRLLIELLSAYQGQSHSGLFDRDLLHQFFKRLPQTDKAMGFDMPLFNGASCGQRFSLNSIGHLGFTGTSFWMDLDKSIIVVLLTNRVAVSDDNSAIRQFRPAFQNAVVEALDG